MADGVAGFQLVRREILVALLCSVGFVNVRSLRLAVSNVLASLSEHVTNQIVQVASWPPIAVQPLNLNVKRRQMDSIIVVSHVRVKVQSHATHIAAMVIALHSPVRFVITRKIRPMALGNANRIAVIARIAAMEVVMVRKHACIR